MSEWRPIKTFRGETSRFDERKQVDLWLTIHASPLSMGWGDAFRVTSCWRRDGKWFHLYQGKATELNADYITHWMWVPKPPSQRAAKAAA